MNIVPRKKPSVFKSFFKRIQINTPKKIFLFDFFELFFRGLAKGMFTYRSGAVSFSFFMAIFPFLLFVLNLVPFVPIDNFQNDILEFIQKILPPKTSDLFNNIFYDIAKNQRGGLLSSVAFLSLFLMTNGINSVIGGFEYSYHTTITRNIIKQYFIAGGIALGFAIALILGIAIFVYLEVYIYPNIQYAIDVVHIGKSVFSIFNYVYFLSILFLFVSVLYYFGTAEGKESRFFSIGSLFAVLLIIINTYFFGIYINNFSQYNELYGSIGTVLILMVYIWLNCNILLLGFEVNASLTVLKRDYKANK